VIELRPVALADAPTYAALIAANLEHLALAGPVRPPDAASEIEVRSGHAFDYAILLDGEIVGRIRLSNVVRGPFRSCFLGYWVVEAASGRGVGSAAVGRVCELAFGLHDLHRVQAATRLDNGASQAVLRKNGFRLEGIARHYLEIAGTWRDHAIWTRTVEDVMVVPVPPRSPGGLVVQPATDADAGPAARLLGDVAAEPEGTLLSTGAVDERRERRRVRALRGSRDGVLLVALLDGRVVGRLDATRDLHPAAAHVAEFGLVVARDVRRRGVGSALLAALRRWCGEVGITRLELHVFPENAPSLAFFRRHGFVEEGLRRDRFVRAGASRDVIVMAGPA
jgi:[ribosomal protein S5]-alanine N-acetyltransferase